MGDAYAATPQAIPAGPQYVAMGHIHAPQKVPGAPVPAEYAGSLLRARLRRGRRAEAGRDRGRRAGTARGGRDRPIAVRPPPRPVRTDWDAIEARADELADAFLDLTVKTRRRGYVAGQRAREAFPFLVNVRPRGGGPIATAGEAAGRTLPSCTTRTSAGSAPTRSRRTTCSICFGDVLEEAGPMRPLELTVEGFRSYRGSTTFDWRDGGWSASSGRSARGSRSSSTPSRSRCTGRRPPSRRPPGR